MIWGDHDLAVAIVDEQRKPDELREWEAERRRIYRDAPKSAGTPCGLLQTLISFVSPMVWWMEADRSAASAVDEWEAINPKPEVKP